MMHASEKASWRQGLHLVIMLAGARMLGASMSGTTGSRPWVCGLSHINHSAVDVVVCFYLEFSRRPERNFQRINFQECAALPDVRLSTMSCS